MSRTKNKFDDVPGTAFFQGYTNNSIGKSTFIAEKAKREMEVYQVAKEYLAKIDAEREEARLKYIAEYEDNHGAIQKKKRMDIMKKNMTAAAIKI